MEHGTPDLRPQLSYSQWWPVSSPDDCLITHLSLIPFLPSYTGRSEQSVLGMGQSARSVLGTSLVRCVNAQPLLVPTNRTKPCRKCREIYGVSRVSCNIPSCVTCPVLLTMQGINVRYFNLRGVSATNETKGEGFGFANRMLQNEGICQSELLKFWLHGIAILSLRIAIPSEINRPIKCFKRGKFANQGGEKF